MRTSTEPAFFKSPERLLEELGIDEPGEIQIEAIAQYCGATVVYEPLEGSDARIIGYGGRAIITIHNRTNSHRQRFSAAHELGHWMWDRGKMAFSCDGSSLDGEWAGDNPERRANEYAVNLLLPKAMFGYRTEGMPIDFSTVAQLAQEFRTSLTATAIRLVELTREPAILIFSEKGQRKWTVRSNSVPQGLRVRKSLDPKSLAFALFNSPNSAKGPVEVQAKRWFEEAEASAEMVTEDSVNLRSEVTLTLISWELDFHAGSQSVH